LPDIINKNKRNCRLCGICVKRYGRIHTQIATQNVIENRKNRNPL